jgi:hypothetical protein
MLDVHPPHESVHSWKDFLIHMMAICLGLLIAVGLEQTVEWVHHRHQRQELAEQMRAEARRNIPVIRESIRRLDAQAEYIRAIENALSAGKVSGDTVAVSGVTPSGGSVFYISPSRAAWSTAQTAGIAALLPADQSNLYSRLDFEASHEVEAEDDMEAKLSTLVSVCASAHYDHTSTTVSRITIEHRDDLIFHLQQVGSSVRTMSNKLSLVEGADEAILAGVQSLDQMYAFQNAALARANVTSSPVLFYGGSSKFN